MPPPLFALPALLIGAFVTLFVASAFVYVAARFVLGRSSFGASLLTVLAGTLLATAVQLLFRGLLGLFLAAAAWALVAAFFFRTKWVKGALLGVTAWFLWAIVNFLVDIVV